jgi:hypothetical protein
LREGLRRVELVAVGVGVGVIFLVAAIPVLVWLEIGVLTPNGIDEIV